MASRLRGVLHCFSAGLAFSDAQWLVVDLGARYNVNEVKFTWGQDA